MSDTPEPVRIMLDGMDETPIAIPFPFRVGEYIIRDPDEWNWFRRHYADLVAVLEDALALCNDTVLNGNVDWEILGATANRIEQALGKAGK